MIGKKLLSAFLIAAIGLSALWASSLASAQGAPQATIEKPQRTVIQIAEDTPEISTFVSLLERENMTGLLNDTTANYTVLAPDNTAFANLDNFTRAVWIENTTNLRHFLFNHILQGTVNFTQNGTVATLDQNKIPYSVNGSIVTFDGVIRTRVTQANVSGNNGVIDVINEVLIPLAKASTPVGIRVAPTATANPSPVPGFDVLFGIGSLTAVAVSRYATRLRKK